MTFEKAGLNLTALNNMTALNITYNTTVPGIIKQSVSYANSMGIWFSSGILFTIMLLVLIYITDVTPFGKVRYSYIRGTCISLAISSLLGVTMVTIGWIQSLKIVGIFYMLMMLSLLFVIAEEKKQ